MTGAALLRYGLVGTGTVEAHCPVRLPGRSPLTRAGNHPERLQSRNPLTRGRNCLRTNTKQGPVDAGTKPIAGDAQDQSHLDPRPGSNRVGAAERLSLPPMVSKGPVASTGTKCMADLKSIHQDCCISRRGRSGGDGHS
ncbi:MAG: hypothetical protein MZV63_72410 [Marinilabiliales bacterium]|nr:hypothetical protein [Marinilabiliales bacterium]